LIEDFTRQIREAVAAGRPIEFTEIHQEDGVLRELGDVVDGWVKPNQHLGVLVRLDKDNPAARYLHKAVKPVEQGGKGKQVGMSIFGHVPAGGFKTEWVPEVGKALRTFYNVKLTSIGRTTRPVWTHSLGTVLAKAVADSTDATGANPEMTKEKETPKASDNRDEPKETVTPNAADDLANPEVETKMDDEPKVEDTTTATTPGEGDKEKKADEHARLLAEEAAAPTGMTNDEIAAKAQPTVDKVRVAKINQLFTLMQEFDLIDKVDTTSQPETPVVGKSEPTGEDIGEVVRKAVEDATTDLRTKLTETETQLQAVLANTPEGSAPALLAKSEETEEFLREFNAMSPSERLRFALAATHGK
jgi:hypothetical protein